MLKLLLALSVLIVLAVVFTLWKAGRHEARAEASHPPIGDFLEIDGHRVHYIVEGSGPDLVLLHGSSGNLRDFTFSLVGKLSEQYRVIAFDRPGHGYTDRINRTGATLEQQAQLLSRAAQTLGADRPIVLGQSYGGAVALAWAVHHPDKLAAVVPLAAASHSWTTGLSRFYRLTSHPWIGPLIIPVLTAFVPDRRVSDALRSIFAPQDEPAGYDAYIGTGLTLRRASLRANALQRCNLLDEILALSPRYTGITAPIEAVHGDADDTVPHWNHAERLQEQVPAVNLTLLPGVGHMPHHVAEDAVIAAVHRAAQRAGLR